MQLLAFFFFFSIIYFSVVIFAMMDWVKMSEVNQQVPLASRVIWGKKADDTINHECTFYLKNPHKQELEDLLLKISDPKNEMYGKHLTKSQIDEMSKNEEGEKAVLNYLHSIGDIHVEKVATSHIKAISTIANWEKVFNTEYFEVQMPEDSQIYYRCKTYYLPTEVAQYVSTVTGTDQLPVRVKRMGVH